MEKSTTKATDRLSNLCLLVKHLVLSDAGSVTFGYHEAPVTVPGEGDFFLESIWYESWRSFPLTAFLTGGCLPFQDMDERTLKTVIRHILAKRGGERPHYEEIWRITELQTINMTFIITHGDIDALDLRMIEKNTRALRAVREKNHEPVPLPGDLVTGAYYDGRHPFDNGVIETVNQTSKDYHFCAQPYVPHVTTTKDGEPWVTTSGGPFFGVDRKDLEYVGEDIRLFCDWGHCGPAGDGLLNFYVKVNKWRVLESAGI